MLKNPDRFDSTSREENPRPPRWAEQLLEWFVAPHLAEYVQGDLHEMFTKRVRQVGTQRAHLEYAWAVLQCLTPFFAKRRPREYYPTQSTTAMLSNFLKINLRNLWKHRSLTLINLVGLSSGMACSLLILLFVRHETSYDRFHTDADRIYRVVKDFVNEDGSRLPDATTPPALAPAMQRQIAEVQHVTRVFPNWGNRFLVQHGDKQFYEEGLYRVDSSFFQVFTFPFVAGNAQDAFRQVNAIVLTQRAARKYFGSQDPVGKILQVDNLGDLTVSGVVQDVPEAAHFHFDLLVPIRKIEANLDANWGWYNFYTYIKLKPNMQMGRVEPKIQALYRKNDREGTNRFYAQALTDIHLTSNLKWELEPNSDRLYVYVFSIIGVFVLLIALINYVNLATAKSSLRAKEVGVRKVSGAGRSSLIQQFLLESLTLCLLSTVVAILLAQGLLRVVNALLQKRLELFSLENAAVFGWILLAGLLIGMLAGLLPALYLSSFKPVVVLKGLKWKENGLLTMRKGLVVVQFTLSVALVAGAVIIWQQMRFVQSAHLGLNKDQVLIIRDAQKLPAVTRSTLQQAIRQLSGVSKVALSDGVVGGLNWTNGLRVKGSQKAQLVNYFSVDYDFLEAMGMRIKEGRNFSADFPADTLAESGSKSLNQIIGSIILNERAVKELAVPKPVIGQQIVWGKNQDTTYNVKVIGVVEDFHFTSLRSEIKPFAFVNNPREQSNFTIKLSATQVGATLAQIQKTWHVFVPDRPIQYSFLDETFAQQYAAEIRFQRVFILLVGLSIVIACLGLFALSAFMAEQRFKEIGVRKVLGASITSIVTLLSKDFLRLVLLAVVIASPLAWYVMQQWLEGFAYRITIQWWVFLLTGVVALGIALLTVSFQSMKAALMNPVKSLRSE